MSAPCKTPIGWADVVWNFIVGCSRLSVGCLNCYIPFQAPMRIGHQDFSGPEIGATTGVKLYSSRLHRPLSWTGNLRVFVNSMSDLFHDEVPSEFIADAFAVMACSPRHTFMALTKRHHRMRALLNDPAFAATVGARIKIRSAALPRRAVHQVWPIPNVHLGVSVENQYWADRRIPALLATPAALRWISAEPLLGYVHLKPSWLAGSGNPDGLGWVVVGGETGGSGKPRKDPTKAPRPIARPMHPAWARQLRDETTAAGVPFFYKQWGDWVPRGRLVDGAPLPVDDERTLILNEHGNTRGKATDGGVSNHVGTFSDSSHCEVMHRVGKRAAGHLLDGAEWLQFPPAPPAPPPALQPAAPSTPVRVKAVTSGAI